MISARARSALSQGQMRKELTDVSVLLDLWRYSDKRGKGGYFLV